MILVLMRHLIIAREVEFTTNEGRIVRQLSDSGEN